MKVNNPIEDVSSSNDGESEQEIIMQPKMSINFTSSQNFELTMSSVAMEVFTNLGNAFAAAVKVEAETQAKETAPYKFRNQCGLSITLNLKDSNFEMYGENQPAQVFLDNNTEVPLQLKEETFMRVCSGLSCELTRNVKVTSRILLVKVTITYKN